MPAQRPGYRANLIKGLKNSATTGWGLATVVAVAINQNPEFVATLAPQFAPKITAAAGIISCITGLLTAAQAADASQVNPQQENPEREL